MAQLTPEHPHDAGIREQVPDQSHIEGAELLANEARPTLRQLGFTDAEINEWALTYITDEQSGDLESFMRWVSRVEDHSSRVAR